MTEFDGTCGTCVLWVKLPFRDIGQCCVTHAVNLDSLYPCNCADKRTHFIRFLVTGPEFVPEEVQKQIATTWTPRDPGWQIEADGLSVTMTNTDEHGGPHEDADDL